jgi:hypothetical protein
VKLIGILVEIRIVIIFSTIQKMYCCSQIDGILIYNRKKIDCPQILPWEWRQKLHPKRCKLTTALHYTYIELGDPVTCLYSVICVNASTSLNWFHYFFPNIKYIWILFRSIDKQSGVWYAKSSHLTSDTHPRCKHNHIISRVALIHRHNVT